MKQALIVVPERSIGASFGDEPLMATGFWADWKVKPRWNLCNMPGADDNGVAKGKVKAVGQFLAGEDKALVCTHATFRFAMEEFGQRLGRAVGEWQPPVSMTDLTDGRDSDQGLEPCRCDGSTYCNDYPLTSPPVVPTRAGRVPEMYRS